MIIVNSSESSVVCLFEPDSLLSAEVLPHEIICQRLRFMRIESALKVRPQVLSWQCVIIRVEHVMPY